MNRRSFLQVNSSPRETNTFVLDVTSARLTYSIYHKERPLELPAGVLPLFPRLQALGTILPALSHGNNSGHSELLHDRQVDAGQCFLPRCAAHTPHKLPLTPGPPSFSLPAATRRHSPREVL
jgi:hypothetical protein